MVTKITVPHSIQRALNYNEQKVQKGAAECLYAHNYLREAHELNFYEKLARFENLMALNARAHTNSLHISINFPGQEQLDRQKLTAITQDFMEKIGFSSQPYLVYQHFDSGHPHLHVVTTNIQENGGRISLHNIGRNQAARARQEIEKAYQLRRTGQSAERKQQTIQTVAATKALYGKSETRQAISNVLNAILPHYKYTSLPELNAILKLYNVAADRGREDSKLFKNRGLIYRILDEAGNKIGVPIKASLIYSKPTLAYLEKRFQENEILRVPYKKRLQTAIDWALQKKESSLAGLGKSLASEKIHILIRGNEQGKIYGLTYIDLQTKCAFNGSDLGKNYSAQGILERLNKSSTSERKPEMGYEKNVPVVGHPIDSKAEALKQDFSRERSMLIEVLLRPERDYAYVPQQLKKPRKKKQNPSL